MSLVSKCLLNHSLSNLLLKAFTESAHMTQLGKVFHVLMARLEKEFKCTDLLVRGLINLYMLPLSSWVMNPKQTAFENIIGKGENTGKHNFLLFPQYFLSYQRQKSLFNNIKCVNILSVGFRKLIDHVLMTYIQSQHWLMLPVFLILSLQIFQRAL